MKSTPPPLVEQLLDKLDAVTPADYEEWEYSACCPAHNDTNLSLSIGWTPEGKLRLQCDAGCSFDAVYEVLGKPPLEGYPMQDAAVERPAADVLVQIESNPDVSRLGKVLARISDPDYSNASDSKENWPARITDLKARSDDISIRKMAALLGFDAWALESLGAFRGPEGVLFCPEFDSQGIVCGMTRRDPGGATETIPGSTYGLYLSSTLNELTGPIYCCEGLSDTAALLTMGIASIGRPAARAGISQLARFLKRLPTGRRIVVLGKLDARSDGTWPGRDAANRVAKLVSGALQREVEVALPPDGAKDVHAWLLSARTQREGEAA